ncbi:hypothetical protein [Rhodococcus sp. ACT016]|uniref:hypothetical protein n=1 Tax=Rhodococcus sp. ACT016 TaxID=3134808 RepID=UPI003D268F81
MSVVSEPIPYDHMRRLLGLPDLQVGLSVRWAVRKIRTGARAGRWGVWRHTGSETANCALDESFPTWPEAIDWVRGAVGGSRRGTSLAERTSDEHRRVRDEVLTQA